PFLDQIVAEVEFLDIDDKRAANPELHEDVVIHGDAGGVFVLEEDLPGVAGDETVGDRGIVAAIGDGDPLVAASGRGDVVDDDVAGPLVETDVTAGVAIADAEVLEDVVLATRELQNVAGATAAALGVVGIDRVPLAVEGDVAGGRLDALVGRVG